MTKWMKRRRQFTLFQATLFGACPGDGGGDGDRPTGTILHENPTWPTLNRDRKSCEGFI